MGEEGCLGDRSAIKQRDGNWVVSEILTDISGRKLSKIGNFDTTKGVASMLQHVGCLRT